LNLHSTIELGYLIKKCLDHNRKAQFELYTLSASYALSIALRYASDYNNAQEIVSESFLKVFNSLSTFDQNQSFAAWLRRIVVNTAIDKFRKDQKNAQRFIHIDQIEREPEETNHVMDKFNAEDIIEKIQQLSPAYRVVFSLYAIEGYSHKEIAEKLGVTESTSKSNYHKAKIQLKKALLSTIHHPKAANNESSR
jgi:RNA polymerase sigma-70 factor (ECF subfamily)